MTTDFRVLCKVLADQLDFNRQLLLGSRTVTHPLADRARRALAEPQPEPPTDDELMEVFWEYHNGMEELWPGDWPAAARAVLARWGNS